eukprot:TRINITY_DN3576_c0_g2_i1.p1 TRINITY_DN3576_c0_g2~~TRINITY_DN3576_c0_g2_i1.p1  ORF type:complete len:252 (+),score=80.00 TRINITY_DN3576_c0_g2_i1:370-1125(+)
MVHIFQNEEKVLPSTLLNEDGDNFVSAPDLKVQLGTFNLDALQEGNDYMVSRLLELALLHAANDENQDLDMLRLLFAGLSSSSLPAEEEIAICECEAEAAEEQCSTPEEVIEQLKHENHCKDLHNEQLQERNSHLEEELARLKLELEQRNRDNAALQEENAHLKAQKRKHRLALRALKTEKSKLETQVREKENCLQMERNRTREHVERIKILEARVPARPRALCVQTNEPLPIPRYMQKKSKATTEKRNDR